MGFGLQPRDRRQAHREHRSGSQVSNMVASRAPCLNRVQGAAHRVGLAHFDNREHPAGMDLCVYCDVGYEFRFSPPNWGVVDPWGGVAKWLAAKAFPRHGNLLRVLQPVRVQIRRDVKQPAIIVLSEFPGPVFESVGHVSLVTPWPNCPTELVNRCREARPIALKEIGLNLEEAGKLEAGRLGITGKDGLARESRCLSVGSL